jgi:DNA polymerase
VASRVDTFEHVRTNLVATAPLAENGKLRYPTASEMRDGLTGLISEIRSLRPTVVLLLGNKVAGVVLAHHRLEHQRFRGFDYRLYPAAPSIFVPIHHPSYIAVYKRRQTQEFAIGVRSAIFAAASYGETAQA